MTIKPKKYRINELAEFMDAYTLNYLTQSTSEKVILLKPKQTRTRIQSTTEEIHYTL